MPNNRRHEKLYRFNKTKIECFAAAARESRLNFYGRGDSIALKVRDKEGRPGLEYLTGISSSTVGPIELGFRQMLPLDIVVSMWIALGSGQAPLICPETGLPYTWQDIWGMVELNPRLVEVWQSKKLRLRSLEEVLNADQWSKNAGAWTEEDLRNQIGLLRANDAVEEKSPGASKRRELWLYEFSRIEQLYFGIALNESRTNFYGDNQPITLRDLEPLTGHGHSIISKLERAEQQSLALDVIATIWVAMASGHFPPAHPVTGDPYSTNTIAGLLTINPEVVDRWEESGLRLKSLDEVSQTVKPSETETDEPSGLSPKMVWLIQRIMSDRNLSEKELAKLIPMPYAKLRQILLGQINVLDLEVKYAKLIYSLSKNVRPQRFLEWDWTLETFVEWLTGSKFSGGEESDNGKTVGQQLVGR